MLTRRGGHQRHLETLFLQPTGVALANPGDTMRFTFALVLSATVPEVFNPAAGENRDGRSRTGPA